MWSHLQRAWFIFFSFYLEIYSHCWLWVKGKADTFGVYKLNVLMHDNNFNVIHHIYICLPWITLRFVIKLETRYILTFGHRNKTVCLKWKVDNNCLPLGDLCKQRTSNVIYLTKWLLNECMSRKTAIKIQLGNAIYTNLLIFTYIIINFLTRTLVL